MLNTKITLFTVNESDKLFTRKPPFSVCGNKKYVLKIYQPFNLQ